MPVRIFRQDSGFSLVQALIGIAIVAILLMAVVSLSGVQSSMGQSSVARSGRDRIVSSIHKLAGNPASLRNSMRVVDSSGNPINPGLLACAGGNPASSCQNDREYPLTLFSPLIRFDATGAILGVQPLTAPIGAAGPRRFDAWGSPCDTDASAATRCPFLVYTSFVPTCGAAALTGAQLAQTLLPNQIAPVAVCTIADSITVRFSVQVDPAIINQMHWLAPFSKPLIGSASVETMAISGNQAQ